jgi:hypothetical protein
VPAAIYAIVRKAMAKDRSQRYADVTDLRHALQAAALESGLVSTFDSSAPHRRSSRAPMTREVKIETPAVFERPFPNAQPPRSRNWLIGVSLLAAAGGAAGWLLSGSLTEEPTRTSSATMQPSATEARPAPVTPQPALPSLPAAAPAPAPEATPTTATDTTAPNAGAPAAAPAPSPSPGVEPPASRAASSDTATPQRKPPMPANLAAFLADAGIPVDSVTPREARRMLIQSRTDARAAARAEGKRAREALRHPDLNLPAPADDTLSIKPMPGAPAATKAPGQ